MRRKILMGVLSLALPVGILGVTQSAAVAKAPPNPTSCTGFGAVVAFAGALTNEGVPETTKAAGGTTVTASSFTCAAGAASNSQLNIAGGKNSKNPGYSKSACTANPNNAVDCDKYVTQTWGEFAAAGGSLKKSIKSGITFTIAGTPNTFKVKGSTEVVGSPCAGDEVGFDITGQVTGTYDTKSANLLVCLGTDTRADASHGVFGGDLLTDNGGGVVSAQIDPVTSNATL
jgi:hypothetical protein